MFPKNAWYVAAMAHEVASAQVMGRTVCNIPLAIFRAEDGKIGILLDRCPHRLFPLSSGKVETSGLRCGYHGLVFGTDGACREIPSQSEIPGNACVESFPVQERFGLIWFWPGDPALAGGTPLPGFEPGEGYQAGLDFSCLEPGDAWGVAGPHVISVKAAFMLAVDNLLDLTHTAFVHAETFDNAGVLDSTREIKSLGGNRLADFFAFKNRMSESLRRGYILDEDVPLFDNYLETYWQAPGVMILVHGAVPPGQDREEAGAIVLNTNILSPETDRTCHYFWAQSVYRNRGQGMVRDRWDAMTRAAFAEDERTLETQQANLDRFGFESIAGNTELMLKADKAIVMARRIVDRMIRDEKTDAAT